MNERIGLRVYQLPEPGEMAMQKPYSELTAGAIDEEVKKLIDQAYTRTMNLLTEKKTCVQKVCVWVWVCVDVGVGVCVCV